MSTFKPPLSIDELKAIQARSKDDPDAMALLWEIKRLHAIVLRAHQACRSAQEKSSSTDMILGWLWDEIRDEPIVKDRLGFEQRILYPDSVQDDDDAR